MKYLLIKNVIDLVKEYENDSNFEGDIKTIEGFKNWIANQQNGERLSESLDFEGKENGRSLESVISTLLVHLGRYARLYSKSAIHESIFSTQDEFIFLITLKSFGSMSKMELIKRNIHDKPSGMQIISRLLNNNLVIQKESIVDKRSKILSITPFGLQMLEEQMDHIRVATKIVSGNLNKNEKAQLVYLLTKLEDFHMPIYSKNIDSEELLNYVKTKKPEIF